MDTHIGMKPRDYDQVQEILAENIVRPNTTKNKYRFFKELEEKIYRSSGSSSIDPRLFRQFLSLPILMDTSGKLLPYWEIHHYQGGFTNIFPDVAEKEWFDDKKDNEQHFYFTLRSLITKEHYENLKKDNLDDFGIKYDFGIEVIKAGKYDCKIDKRYTGNQNDQEGIINIIILDDKQDNFDYLQTLVSYDIWNCISEKGKALKYKPSQLPQIMFLSHTSTFNALTENVESIVCMDRFTHLGTNDSGGILKIKGNIFLNESAIVVPSRYGRKDIESYVGKNTIFGIDCRIASVYIDDFVVVANGVNAGVDTYIKSNCIITEGTKITEYQNIPAGQKITAKVPLFLNILKDDDGFLLNDFYRLAEGRRDYLLKGMLPGFAWWND